MKKQTMTLAGIPAILYGNRSRNVYLYLHGKNGCKEEAERFAATACEAGWQVLEKAGMIELENEHDETYKVLTAFH